MRDSQLHIFLSSFFPLDSWLPFFSIWFCSDSWKIVYFLLIFSGFDQYCWNSQKRRRPRLPERTSIRKWRRNGRTAAHSAILGILSLSMVLYPIRFLRFLDPLRGINPSKLLCYPFSETSIKDQIFGLSFNHVRVMCVCVYVLGVLELDYSLMHKFKPTRFISWNWFLILPLHFWFNLCLIFLHCLNLEEPFGK